MTAAMIPVPTNEPEHRFERGSAERRALDAALADRTIVDIPVVIGGRAMYSNDVEDVRAPHDQGRVLARVHKASAKDVQAALDAALAAARDWAAMSLRERAGIFLRAAELAGTRHRIALNAATMLGQSKTLDQAEPDAACELIDFLRFNASGAERIHRDQPISTAAAANRTEWRPLEGFVYAISPFNFTAIGANLSTAPALMGNVVVWKPSPKSVLANYRCYQVLVEAGLPPGVINFVPGDAPIVSETLLASPAFAGLHFTGSSAVFKNLWSEIGARVGSYRGFPRVVGETGGKGFVLVHPSADVPSIAPALLRGAFEYQGQKCSAASRAYVPRSLWPRVRDELVDVVAQVKVGDVADVETFMGAVIDKASFDRLDGRLQRAGSDANAHILCGGNTWNEPGHFVAPTVVELRDPRHPLLCDELFGPILSVHVYEDADWGQVLSLVDTTSPYALTGSIFCSDRHALAQAEAALAHAAGNLYVNDKPTGAIVGQQPFGGSRASGTNDKAGSWLNLLRWTSPRVVKENFAGVQYGAFVPRPGAG